MMIHYRFLWLSRYKVIVKKLDQEETSITAVRTAIGKGLETRMKKWQYREELVVITQHTALHVYFYVLTTVIIEFLKCSPVFEFCSLFHSNSERRYLSLCKTLVKWNASLYDTTQNYVGLICFSCYAFHSLTRNSIFHSVLFLSFSIQFPLFDGRFSSGKVNFALTFCLPCFCCIVLLFL